MRTADSRVTGLLWIWSKAHACCAVRSYAVAAMIGVCWLMFWVDLIILATDSPSTGKNAGAMSVSCIAFFFFWVLTDRHVNVQKYHVKLNVAHAAPDRLCTVAHNDTAAAEHAQNGLKDFAADWIIIRN